MKNIMAITALVMFVITSAAAMSSDTLRVRSLRTIDKCSGERRALISVDLGRILTTDSLLSFDISIGFDPRVLRPETLLKIGTLGEQMSFGDGPFMVIESPGVARIQGGSIVRPASGSLPLTAFNAAVIGNECFAKSPLTVPFGIDFNEEFRKNVEVFVIDSVELTTLSRSVDNGILEITADRDSVQGKDSSLIVVVTYQLDSVTTNDIEIDIALSNDTAFVVESIATLAGMTIERQNTSPFGVTVKGSIQSSSGSIALVLRSTTDSATVTTIDAKVLVDSCQCIRPGRTATRNVFTTTPKPIVSIKDTDENAGMIVVSNSVVDIQNFHEWPTTIMLYSIEGSVEYSTTFYGGTIRVALDNLADGLYALVVRDHVRTTNQLILKK